MNSTICITIQYVFHTLGDIERNMAIEKYMEECLACPLDAKTRDQLCAVCLPQRVFRGKWKIVILWQLRYKEMRFSELQKSIPNITQAYLSSQLKDLESDKLIDRHSYNEIPPRVEYTLTDAGKSFIEVIEKINAWGSEYASEQMAQFMQGENT